MLVAAGAGGLALTGCAGGVGRGGEVSLEPGISPPLFYLGRNKVFALLADGGAPVTLVEEDDGAGPISATARSIAAISTAPTP